MKNYISNIKKSILYLKKDECIGIPTETVYGLAANAYSDIAVLKVYTLKRRPKNNPLIVHYYDLNLLKKDCQIPKSFYRLYKRFCPGPLTFVLKIKKKSRISKKIINKNNTLAVRFPKHPIARKLLKKIPFPLAAPSANVSTSISPVTKKDVVEEFGSKIKYVLDGGRSKIGLESTIIDITNKPKILRLGGLEIKKLRKILNSNIYYKNNDKIKYPGQSKLHYSPGIPIRMNVSKPKKSSAYLLINEKNYKNKNFFYLTKNNNLKEAGKNLYSILRKIKKQKFKLIEVEEIPNIGFGETINDRLTRASLR